MVKKILILVSIVINIISCSNNTFKNLIIEKHFKYCNSNKIIITDSILNISGYYVLYQPYLRTVDFKNNIKVLDTLEENVIFYKNGICVRRYHLVDENNQPINYKFEANYLKNLSEKNCNSKQKVQFYEFAEWGSFNFSKDTIKCHFIHKPYSNSVNDYWSSTEIYFKIISPHKIIELCDGKMYNSFDSKINNLFEFKPSVTPSPDSSWIVKEPWFWCK